MGIFTLIFLLCLSGGPAFATQRISELSVLTPNRRLVPLASESCAELLSPVLVTAKDFLDARSTPYSERELLKFFDYLLARRFHPSAFNMVKENALVLRLLKEKFGVYVGGKTLYLKLREHFPTMEEAARATPQGRKLLDARNDAEYKRWSEDVLVKLARESERLGIPFTETFLREHAGLVGMKLAEVYGYPVRGDQIIYRAGKLDLTIADVRARAGLPPKSTVALAAVEAPAWTEPLLMRVLTFLRDRKYPILRNAMFERETEITALVEKELGFRVTASAINDNVNTLGGGWRKVKAKLGFTYDNRRRAEPNRPDWTKSFMIELFQFARAEGFDMSWAFLHDKKAFAPFAKLVREKFDLIVAGKNLYGHAFEVFGSFEAACAAAGIPYKNKNYAETSTNFRELRPDSDIHKTNPVVHLEILRLLHALNIDPSEDFLSDESRFAATAANAIENEFGLRLLGKEILGNSLKYFRSHRRALLAADLTDNVEPWSPELLRRVVALVYTHFPRVTFEEMRTTHAEDIGNLLHEELGMVASGGTVARQIWRGGTPNPWSRELIQQAVDQVREAYDAINLWTMTKDYSAEVGLILRQRVGVVASGATLAAVIRENGGLKEFAPVAEPWRPKKKLYLEVLKFINAQGFFPAFTRVQEEPEKFALVQKAIAAKYGFFVSGLSLKTFGDELFGGLPEARAAIGLPYQEQPEWTDAFLLSALKAVYQEYPELAPSRLEMDASASVGEFLRNKFGVKMSGTTLARLVVARFASFEKAIAQVGITPVWSRAFPPSPEQVLRVLQFLETKNYGVTGNRLRFNDVFAEIAPAVEKHFGYKIKGGAVLVWAKRHFGSLANALARARALKTAAEDAGDGDSSNNPR